MTASYRVTLAHRARVLSFFHHVVEAVFVDLVSALHLGDAKHCVFEASETDTTVIFVLSAPVIFEYDFCYAAIAAITVYVVFRKPNSARATFRTVIERLLVLVDEAHKLADITVHGAELEPALHALGAKRLLFATFSTLHYSDVSPIERVVLDVIVALSTTVKFLADRTLL